MSSRNFVISDPHFGHNNMAKYRGFRDSDHHDNYIVERWNSVIGKRDNVYILGDITMEKKTNYAILDKLVGVKKVILGNHDMPNHVPYLLEHVNSVCSMFKFKRTILTHCPIHPSEISRFKLNIHGHTHEKVVKRFGLFPDNRYVNVCCEKIDYTPVNLDNLINGIR